MCCVHWRSSFKIGTLEEFGAFVEHVSVLLRMLSSECGTVTPYDVLVLFAGLPRTKNSPDDEVMPDSSWWSTVSTQCYEAECTYCRCA
jgi:hypothetical protein